MTFEQSRIQAQVEYDNQLPKEVESELTLDERVENITDIETALELIDKVCDSYKEMAKDLHQIYTRHKKEYDEFVPSTLDRIAERFEYLKRSAVSHVKFTRHLIDVLNALDDEEAEFINEFLKEKQNG